jgi:hypothetical protein
VVSLPESRIGAVVDRADAMLFALLGRGRLGKPATRGVPQPKLSDGEGVHRELRKSPTRVRAVRAGNYNLPLCS